MTEKTLTTENIKPALDALRGELAPWPVVAKKQDRLNDTQKSAVNSGITSSLVAQIIANTAAIRALESAITGTGLRALVVSSLPAVGTLGILYIVPVTTYDPENDADVVNYSNEYIWIVAPDAPVTEGYYEQVGQTGIVINNGQLNITVNGTSVGTFTANQSGDTTAAITVPTNADYVDLSTSQTVTGGKTWTGEQSFTLPIVGSITGTASKAIADEDGTSIKTGYGKLAGSQTWSGTNTWTGSTNYAITGYERGLNTSTCFIRIADVLDSNNIRMGLLNVEVNADKSYSFKTYTYNTTVTTGNAIDTFEVGCDTQGSAYTKINGKVRSNLTPLTNSTYSLGSSSYQWSSVYAQTYYYNGTAWGLDKANVWTANQTVSINLPTITLQDTIGVRNTTPTNTRNFIFSFLDKNGDSYGFINRQHKTTGTHLHQVSISDGTYDYRLQFYLFEGGLSSFMPSNDGVIELGTSSYRWKSLNGINPGALSLPNLAANSPSTQNPPNGWINIDTTDWDKTGNLISYTPPVDGWISIITDNSSAANYIRCAYDNGDILAKANGNGYAQGLSVFLPVLKNVQVGIRLVCTTIGTAKLYPCLGNV